MLEQPNLSDEQFIACLKTDYGLEVAQFEFLPLGANTRAAVYRAVTRDGTPYFVKLRRGTFDEMTVELPKFLSKQGIQQIIAPLETKNGRLRTELAEFKLIVYPFVEGQDGYQVVLSEQQWAEFGAALQAIHSVTLPPSFVQSLEPETYTPFWRERVMDFLKQVEHDTFDDAIAAEAAAFLHSKRADVVYIVERAEELGYALQERAPKFVLCHNDMHGGNLLVTAQGALYLVDWDSPILAPRERDLMFIGGGQGFAASSEDEAERLFYRGYGDTPVDLGALAYFRFERVLYDICVECERMFSGQLNPHDQAQSLDYLKWEWSPNFMIDRAYHADRMQRAA